MRQRAIISVHDKRGLADFAGALVELGWELVASGGTAGLLRQHGLDVLDVAAVTGAPEMLGGRVKTLHPAIHGGILARDTAADRDDLAAQGIGLIDLVVCNLYPFQQTVARPGVTLAEAIEQIDIGGVTLLRAAAKNFGRVAVVCDPADYPAIVAALQANGAVSEATRRQLALKAFAHTRDYDTAIADYLAGPAETGLPARLRLDLRQVQSLRYGENPHQAAALYGLSPEAGPLGGELLQGKELSYNNLLDLDAAWRAAESFEEAAVVIVKHLSPCGLATGETAAAAFPLALASDPVSAFGGVIAVNRPVDQAFAEAVEAAGLFIEAVVAPSFTPESLAWFGAKKKNCRLVALEMGTRGNSGELGGTQEGDKETRRQGNTGEEGGTQERVNLPEVRTVRGGILVQERDMGDPAGTEWRVVSQRRPTEAEWAALRFAWIAVQHVKSNGIAFAIPGATVGIGGGLPSRVDAVKLAAVKAGERAKGAVMASDAFFPFPDGIEEAAAAGVTAVVEPGGSVRDDEVIAAADRLGLALVFTGTRHFRH